MGSHPHGTALVVDLGRVVGILELTDHIAERTHLAVPQKLRGGAVQRGNLVKRDLSHIGGEIAVLHVQQIPVGARTEDGEGDDGAYDGHQDQRQKQDADRQALGLDELEILFGTAAAQVEPGGDQGADHVDHAEDADEQVKVAGLEIDGGQGYVKIEEPDHSGDDQVDQDLAELAFGTPALLGRLLIHKYILLLPLVRMRIHPMTGSIKEAKNGSVSRGGRLPPRCGARSIDDALQTKAAESSLARRKTPWTSEESV